MYGVSPLCPAYGRDYKSKLAVQLDFMANKDFVCPTGQYINKTGLKELGITSIEIRYKRKTQCCILRVS